MDLLPSKKKFIRNLTILTLGISACTILIFQLFFPDQYFVCYPFIPLFFYLFGWCFINMFLYVYQHDESKVMPLLLLCRGLKFFLSLVAVIICGYIARMYLLSFGLVMASYYLIYLIFETCFFFQVEMELKK